MNRWLTLLVLLLVGMGTITDRACAGWWIFGQSQDEVLARYLYLNDIAYDELGDKVTVFSETLEQGRVVFKGRGQAGRKSRIGSVQISLDGGATWNKARLADDGSFEYGFVPQKGEVYQVAVKILDTAGKSNDVEATRKALTVSDRNITTVIRAALDGLIAAYQDENIRAFMDLVDEDFAGDEVVLDRAVRRDFTLFDSLRLGYTLNNVTAGARGQVFVSITFSRQVTSTRSGQTLQDRGVTEFIFVLRGDQALVSAMKNPLIFGLSDAAEVATGSANSAENSAILIVDEDGGMRLGPVGEAGQEGDDEGSNSQIPAPTNFEKVYFSYPVLEVRFDIPSVVSASHYRRIVEWRASDAGPWQEDDSGIMTGADFNHFSLHCRPEVWESDILCYRVCVERISDGERSDWSNVLQVLE